MALPPPIAAIHSAPPERAFSITPGISSSAGSPAARQKKAILSGEEKVAKPDKKIFEILLFRNGLKAVESVFIDDNLRNVEAAIALGFTGIHFISPQKLHAELRSIGFRNLPY